MPQEFKTQGEPLEKDQKTKVTYHGDEKSEEVAIIFGVPMKKGESVDLAEYMGRDQALKYVEKLKTIPQFEVEGTPRAKPAAGGRVLDQAASRSATEQVVNARALAERQGREPPEGYDAPMQAVLESRKQAEQQSKQQKQEEQPASQRSMPPKGR